STTAKKTSRSRMRSRWPIRRPVVAIGEAYTYSGRWVLPPIRTEAYDEGAMRILTAILLSVACLGALAQDKFPTRPITLVCPFQAGGVADAISRAVAPVMSESLRTPVIVDNRPGATGAIGASYVARAKPDGHTLLIVPNSVLVINQWVYKSLPYNPDTDFVP